MKVREFIKYEGGKISEFNHYTSKSEDVYWRGHPLSTSNGYYVTKHKIGGSASLGSSIYIEEQDLFVCWWRNNMTYLQIKRLRDNKMKFFEKEDEMWTDMVTNNDIRNGVRFTKPYVVFGTEWAKTGWNVIISCLHELSQPKAVQHFADNLEFLTFEIHQPKMEWSEIKLMNASQKLGRSKFYSYQQEIDIRSELRKKQQERLGKK